MHGYDEMGNRKYREDDVADGLSAPLDELYTYLCKEPARDFCLAG